MEYEVDWERQPEVIVFIKKHLIRKYSNNSGFLELSNQIRVLNKIIKIGIN